MNFLVCPCGTSLRITGDVEELRNLLGEDCEWYPNKYPCPMDGCQHKMTITSVVESKSLQQLTVYDVTVAEAYAAVQGAGLPEERDCGAERVQQLLLQHRVVSADVRQMKGANRSVLLWVQLENGVKLFLGSGPTGAVVYRVAQSNLLGGG